MAPTLLQVGPQGPGWETAEGEEVVAVREQQALSFASLSEDPLCSGSQKPFVRVLVTPEVEGGPQSRMRGSLLHL